MRGAGVSRSAAAIAAGRPSSCRMGQSPRSRSISFLRKAAGVSKEEAAELGMDEVASRAIGAECDLGLLTGSPE